MKKLNKFVAILVALAMMAALAVTSAFAYDGTDEKVGEADSAVITKYLKLPSGVTIPNDTFTFVVTKVTSDAPDVKAGADLDIATSEMTASDSTVDGSSLVGNLNIAAWFDVNSFPHAGAYEYTVKETNKGQEVTTTAGKYTASDREYTITIYVKSDKNGAKTIDAIAAHDSTGEKKKADVTKDDPTEPDATEDNVTDANAEGATFTNTYTEIGNKEDDIDPENDYYGDLGVKKLVAGTYADHNAKFKFSVTVNKPTAGYPVDTVEAYYYDGTTKGNMVTFTFGTPTTIDLSDGMALSFLNLPEGATYSVTEELATTTTVTPAEYKASYETKNKDSENADTSIVTAEAVEATAAGANLALADANKKAIVNADKINTVIYTNTSEVDDTPEGILISNLPYIALALVAVGGLVAYVVVRRKADDEA